MKFTISIAQMAVVNSSPDRNLEKAEAFIAEAKKRGSRVVCFPEMWTTGFNWAYNEKIARDHEKVIDRIGQMAKRHGIWINGSTIALNEHGRLANASILFDEKGERRGTYNKTHLFSPVHEEKHLEAGSSLCVVDTPWGLTGLSVCYDIRFPELFRAYALKGVRIVFSPMAFPRQRLEHWRILVRARAIENQIYMVGTNQVGTEKCGDAAVLDYCGSSVIIDPWGDTIIEGGNREEELLTATIDMDKVDEVRRKMRVLEDRRPDLYQL